LRDAKITLDDAAIYVARTYAYVAAGKTGVAIVDVENPEAPRLDQIFNANPSSRRERRKIGMVDASRFRIVADGRNGLRVLEIVFAVDDSSHFSGFIRANSRLIATLEPKALQSRFQKGIDPTARSTNRAIRFQCSVAAVRGL